jgi:hypothetical protein
VDDINRFAEADESNNVTSTNLLIYATGYAVNSGGSATGSFAADNYWSGSANTYSVTNAIDAGGITNPAPQAVYQTERWGNSIYTFSALVPGASYSLRLHWAEISPSVSGAGGRQFHVTINGTQVLTNFDIFAAAGGKFKAVVRQFTVAANSSGQIILQLTQGASNEAKIGGIEITATAPRISGITVAAGAATITWLSFPGKSYRVEYKGNLNDPAWTTLGADLLAVTGTLSFTNNPAPNTLRFYRIRQLN